jgi:hypothetical protein
VILIDVNTKKGALLLLVQAWVLAAGSQKNNDPLHQGRFAINCIADVLALDEDAIPEDVEWACEQLMYYQDGIRKPSGGKYECPAWFKPNKKNGGPERLYPWSKHQPVTSFS